MVLYKKLLMSGLGTREGSTSPNRSCDVPEIKQCTVCLCDALVASCIFTPVVIVIGTYRITPKQNYTHPFFDKGPEVHVWMGWAARRKYIITVPRYWTHCMHRPRRGVEGCAHQTHTISLLGRPPCDPPWER